MDRRQAQEAEVDVCGSCRGLWIDWFDGDAWTVASDALPLSERAPVVLPQGASCPRCEGPLSPGRHANTGPVVLRCAECFGTFVPRASLPQLLAFPPQSARVPLAEAEAEPRPSSDRHRETFVDRIKRALGA
jgi:Zn-finger nucleic acid-binding protein